VLVKSPLSLAVLASDSLGKLRELLFPPLNLPLRVKSCSVVPPCEWVGQALDRTQSRGMFLKITGESHIKYLWFCRV
jgi:hypothetical protein